MEEVFNEEIHKFLFSSYYGFSITVSTNTASAGIGDTNSQYVVSEQNGLRTVTDQTTGATATYDAMYGVLTYHENHSHTTSISNVDPY